MELLVYTPISALEKVYAAREIKEIDLRLGDSHNFVRTRRIRKGVLHENRTARQRRQIRVEIDGSINIPNIIPS